MIRRNFLAARSLNLNMTRDNRSQTFCACIHVRRISGHSPQGGFPGLHKWCFTSPIRMNFGSGWPLAAGFMFSSKYQWASMIFRFPSSGSLYSRLWVQTTSVPVWSRNWTAGFVLVLTVNLPVKYPSQILCSQKINLRCLEHQWEWV